MFIPDPDFYPSRIPDPGSRIPDPKTATKERGEKKLDVKPFYVATKFNKIVNNFSFEVLKKKNLGQFSKNYRTFYQKNCQKALQRMVLGSGIRKKHIPDPGSRGQKGTGSRIRDGFGSTFFGCPGSVPVFRMRIRIKCELQIQKFMISNVLRYLR
jgi:hypothetical protein